MAKKEEIYPKGYPRQKEDFSDEQKFKFDVFEAVKETALETTEKAFKDNGYTKQEGRAGEYGTGDSYGAGTSLNHFNIRLSSRPNTNTYFEKIIYFGGKKAITEVSIGWDAKNKAIEVSYKNSEFSAFRGYGSKTGPQLVNDRRNFVVKSLPEFKKELKELLKSFAEKEVAYITSTKVGIEDKTEKSINSMVETSMKKFSLKDLMTSSDEDLSAKMDNYINEGKEDKEDKARMNNPEVIAANSPDKLLFDKEELEDGAEPKIDEITASGGNAAGGAFLTPMAFKKGGDLGLGENKEKEEEKTEGEEEKKTEKTAGEEKFEKTSYAQGQKQRPSVKKSMKEGDSFWTTVELNPGSGYVPKGMEHNFVMGQHGEKAEKHTGQMNEGMSGQYAMMGKNEILPGVIAQDYVTSADMRPLREGELYFLSIETAGDSTRDEENGIVVKVIKDNRLLKVGDINYSSFNGEGNYYMNGVTHEGEIPYTRISRAVNENIKKDSSLLKESLIKKKFSSMNENAEKGINKRYIITEQRTQEEEQNRWKKLAMFEKNDTINASDKIIEENCGCGDVENSHDVSMDQGQTEVEREFMQRNSDAEAGGEVNGRAVIMVPKPNSLSNAMFKVFEDDYLNEGKAYIKDLNSGNLVANPNFKVKK